MKESTEPRGWKAPELWLLFGMLIALTVLVLTVLRAPVPTVEGGNATAKEVIDYRQDLMAVIITAFGVWIGAGAAYFFGRENLQKATESMLKMRDPSVQEILYSTRVQELPLKRLGREFKLTDTIGIMHKYIKGASEIWFIPIVKKDGSLDTVIKEDAVYRFVDDKMQEREKADVKIAKGEVDKMTVKDLLDWIPKEDEKRLKDIFITVTKETSAGVALDMMERRDVYLSIVTDENDKPMFYVDTADIRRMLTRGP